jgi:DNA-directed RNA polymerase subunit RPC12/RpoP
MIDEMEDADDRSELMQDVYITETEINSMINGAKEMEITCPYCTSNNKYCFSNGELFDITNEGCIIQCPECNFYFKVCYEEFGIWIR